MNIPPKKVRAFAMLTDTIILAVISILFYYFNTNQLLNFSILIFVFSYFPMFHWIFGRTIGDLIWGLKIVNADGKKPGFWSLTDRFFGVFAKFYIFSMLVDSLILLLALSEILKDVLDEPLNYEKESKTYLVLNTKD